MPTYEYYCPKCKASVDVYKALADASNKEACPSSCGDMERVYSIGKTKEFVSFYDDQYGCVISSQRQEQKLMRQHGHIDARDTPQRKKFFDQVKRRRRNRVYSIPKG